MRFGALLRVSKNASMLLLGTMLRMLLSFAFVVYAARYFGVEGFGKYALTQHFFELFLSLSATGLAILVTRETAKDIHWLGRNLLPTVALGLIVVLCAGGILAALAWLAGYAADTQLAIYIACLALIPAALASLAEAVFVALEKAEMVAVGTATEGLVRIALCFAVLLMGYGLLALFVVLIATRVMLLGLYAWLLARRLPPIRWRLPLRSLWSLARQWRIFAAETWLATLYLSLDVVLLSLFLGEAAVGLYEAAWKLIRLGPVVANSFTTAVFPYISRLYATARNVFQQLTQQTIKYILAAVLPAVLAISFLADRIVLLLFDQQYAASVPILRVLVWLLIPQFLNPFLSRVLYARGQQRRSLVVAAVGLVSFLPSACLLIPSYGALGTAWATLLSSYTALACYIAYCTVGGDRRPMLMMLIRQAAAALVLCLALQWMKNIASLLLLIASAALYASLLVALRIVTTNDVELLRELH